jgi:CRISPR-associated protein Cmr1
MSAGGKRTQGNRGPVPVPDLRASSIKGALRFWFRAAAPDFAAVEAGIFGSAESGQSRVLLALSADRLSDDWQFDRTRFDRFNDPPGRGNTHTRNGFSYCAFPFGMRGGMRRGIDPGQSFGLRLRVAANRRGESPDARRLLCTRIGLSFWLAVHLGGLGARSRRGFGSLQLTGLATTDFDSSIDLSPLPDSDDAGPWFQELGRRLTLVRESLGGFASGHHPHLAGARLKLLPQGFDTWEQALNAGGRALQDFRQRLGPDYRRVKAHLCLVQRGARYAGITPTQLAQGPDRAAFGLPLTFRYSTVTREVVDNRNGGTREVPVEITFAARRGDETIDRSASPIHLRVVQIGRRFFALFLWLPSDLLPPGAGLVDFQRHKSAHTPQQRQRHRFPVPSNQVLQQFWDGLSTGHAWRDQP